MGQTMGAVLTKWDVAIRSAFRALVPVAVIVLNAYLTGGLHTWQEWAAATLQALVAKGLISGVTAKSVKVETPVRTRVRA